MFARSAPYYDKFYSFLDYKTAALRLHALITEHHPKAISLLDVACGTGRYLEYLQKHYQVAGLDIQPDLLIQARARCPNTPFHLGDMRNFDLGKKYDVVTCLFCSIGYLLKPEHMEKAISQMAAHLHSDGILIIEPWITPEKYWTKRVTCEVSNDPELKIVRMHTHEREGNVSVFDINYLVGTPNGVTHFTECEKMGLFTQKEYTAALEKAGLDVLCLDEELFPDHKYGIYVGKKTN